LYICCYFRSTYFSFNHTFIIDVISFVKDTLCFNSSRALGYGDKEIIMSKVSALSAKRKPSGVYCWRVATQKDDHVPWY
jgi:hypothetical protein